MTAPMEPGTALKAWIRREAASLGFDAVGFAPARLPPHAGEALRGFLAAGHHGDMEWLERAADRRSDPAALWAEARSVIMLGMNYGPERDPLQVLDAKDRGAISVYAQGADYHDVVKARLKALARALAARMGGEVKVFVDTAPVMEKPLAQAAGIGWQGKHTNLVSRDLGSWLFLGAIFTTADIAPDEPETDHCGTCRRCLDICPTDAFPAPYRLDARRCISYLTIEHKGQIPREFRRAMGNRIYGCDDCLAVCPWNKFAQTAREARFHARASADNPPLRDLIALDDAGFRARFPGSPIKRTGRNRFVRNVLVAAGNSGDKTLAPLIEPLLGDTSPLVRGMAVWAMIELSRQSPDVRSRLVAARDRHLTCETDDGVRAEWDASMEVA